MQSKPPPPQKQSRQPGLQSEMNPPPETETPAYRGSGKLSGMKAIVTGGDSGIGRSVAVYFAREGADVTILYLNEEGDARETERLVKAEGHICHTMEGDVGDERFCEKAVAEHMTAFGRLDILVNNAGEQHPQPAITDITAVQLERTFRTNIFGYFYMSKYALTRMKTGGAIINTASVTVFRGSPQLLDYSSTKGAIVAFTRSLARSLASRGIRVNAVAPGPVWTPLIPSTFDEGKVGSFGTDTPMGRPAQPDELAPAFVFLASNVDSSYITGQTIHVNGGGYFG